MKTCPHCGFPIEDKYDFCGACEWMHLGLSEGVRKKAVDVAQFVLDIYHQRYVVRSVEDVYQLMVDLMTGCDDERTLECVGLLRKILEVSVEQELAQRGYNPDGSVIA